jgi:poly-gamma-glutamate capsule biosynthesis protein CapA/YwtB (metallophosphatase superfamily)
VGGETLKRAGIDAVGIANNVNYGDAAITASVSQLDKHGIAHTGAGINLAAAREPAIVIRDGIRFGFLQRSSVYWPTNHEARDDAPGIAVIRGHTAYHVPMFKVRAEVPPPNRPGLPPDIITWADAGYLNKFKDDISALRPRVDILVASCHWGLGKDVLQYMSEIAHAAIDSGADVVVGHGPHYSLPVEVYKGKPIFYGLGSFSFHTGHGGRKHGDWVGMMAAIDFIPSKIQRATFRFVRHNDKNETVVCPFAETTDALTEIVAASRQLGVNPVIDADAVNIPLT